MQAFHSFLLAFLFAVTSFAAESEQATISRYLAVKSCDVDAQCIGPTVKALENANVDIELKPFRKLTAKGLDGWERQQWTVDGVTFKSEIHLIKHENPDLHRYYIYATLRSGKRKGVMKTLNFNDFSELKAFELQDKPLKTKTGSVQAQLVIGSKLNLTH